MWFGRSFSLSPRSAGFSLSLRFSDSGLLQRRPDKPKHGLFR
jgi:hypothetical protein